MSKGLKITLIIVIILVALGVLGYVLFNYTTLFMSFRINRLHDQIDERYEVLVQNFDEEEALTKLEDELKSNQWIESATVRDKTVVLKYIDGTVEEYDLK